MKTINGVCTKLAAEVASVPAEANKIIAALPIQFGSNGEDEVNAKAILNTINGLLNQLFTLLNSLNTMLGSAKSAVAFLQNPVGGFLFNMV